MHGDDSDSDRPTDDTETGHPNKLKITFDKDSLTKQHIRDVQNAADFPSGELGVSTNDDTIAVEGTPKAIRWFYDILHQIKRDWRQEGEQWDADVAEDMAATVWESVGDRLPEQQRKKRISDGGVSESRNVSRSGNTPKI